MKGFWIGMAQYGLEENSNFRWRSNPTVSSDVDLYWGWSEPNNIGESSEAENCVEVAWSGPYINDVDCSTKRPFVCQKRVSYSALTTIKNEDLSKGNGNDLSLWVLIGVLVSVVVILLGSLLYCGYRVSNMKQFMVRTKHLLIE